MDYQKIYDSLILNARSFNRKRIRGSILYYESHHIVPKCMGGSDLKENKVLLTAREHFICHKLLVEIYPGNRKLITALLYLSCSKNKNFKHNFRISAREYERIRTDFGLSRRGENHPMYGRCGEDSPLTGQNRTQESKDKMKASAKDKKLSEEHKKNIGISRKGKNTGEDHYLYGKIPSENVLKVFDFYRNELKGDKHPMFGKTHKEETKAKWRIDRKGSGNSMYGVIREKFECEYCHKFIDIANLKRWHGEKCKQNNSKIAA